MVIILASINWQSNEIESKLACDSAQYITHKQAGQCLDGRFFPRNESQLDRFISTETLCIRYENIVHLNILDKIYTLYAVKASRPRNELAQTDFLYRFYNIFYSYSALVNCRVISYILKLSLIMLSNSKIIFKSNQCLRLAHSNEQRTTFVYLNCAGNQALC